MNDGVEAGRQTRSALEACQRRWTPGLPGRGCARGGRASWPGRAAGATQPPPRCAAHRTPARGSERVSTDRSRDHMKPQCRLLQGVESLPQAYLCQAVRKSISPDSIVVLCRAGMRLPWACSALTTQISSHGHVTPRLFSCAPKGTLHSHWPYRTPDYHTDSRKSLLAHIPLSGFAIGALQA